MPDAPSARFDLHRIAAAFPATADTLLLDHYLTDEAAASARVFRVYRGTPPHYHVHSDEYLFVLSGRGTFWMKHASTQQEFAPGHLLFFRRGIVHALPDIHESPVVFYAVDTPRRRPVDIVFVNPDDAPQRVSSRRFNRNVSRFGNQQPTTKGSDPGGDLHASPGSSRSAPFVNICCHRTARPVSR